MLEGKKSERTGFWEGREGDVWKRKGKRFWVRWVLSMGSFWTTIGHPLLLHLLPCSYKGNRRTANEWEHWKQQCLGFCHCFHSFLPLHLASCQEGKRKWHRDVCTWKGPGMHSQLPCPTQPPSNKLFEGIWEPVVFMLGRNLSHPKYY